MVSSLVFILPLVLITAFKWAFAKEENNSFQVPRSLEGLRLSRATNFCNEACNFEVEAGTKKRYSAKLEGCANSGVYNHCSHEKIDQLSQWCMGSNDSAEYPKKMYRNDEYQANCSLLCLINSSPCSMECDCNVGAGDKRRDLLLKYPWHVTNVDLHCQDLSLKHQEVILYVSWKLQKAVDIDEYFSIPRNDSFDLLLEDYLRNLNETTLVSGKRHSSTIPFIAIPPPEQFAVQIWFEESDTWKEVGKTNMTFMMVDHLKPNVSFRVRVQSLDVDGSKIGEDAVSPWLRTTEAHQKPKMVEDIWVKSFFPVRKIRKQGKYPKHWEWKLNVVVVWEPNEDKLCSYDLAFFYPERNREKEIRPPTANFQALFKDLEYSTSYSLKIVAVYPEREEDGILKVESDEKWLLINTSSCEEIWNYNLTICPPPVPENITYELISKGDFSGSPLYDLKIFWSLPDNAIKSDGLVTVKLLIPGYRVIQVSTFDNTTIYYPRLNNSLMDTIDNHSKEPEALQFQVLSDKKEITIPLIVVTSNLIVTIICESEGGTSEGEIYIVSPVLSLSSESEMPLMHLGRGVVIAVVIFVTSVALSVVFLFVIVRRCRKQPIESKTKYLEEVDKVKKAEDDMNEVRGMLHEQILTDDLEGADSDQELEVGDQNEVDEFEISLNRLVIRELLGEGAFGVVYKGYYRASSYRDSVGQRNLANWSGSQSSLWEVVAVKMLREDSSAEEEKQLIHEMETLKYLGKSSHPNVVSLIGCHTRKLKNEKIALTSLMTSHISKNNFSSKPLLLLIVEHCALGDLQTFLRKVWQGSVPFDYFKGQMSNLQGSLLEQVVEQNEIKYINEIPNKILDERPLKYATLDHSASSKEDVTVDCHPVFVANRSYGIMPGHNVNKPESGEVINAKDLCPAYLLSYARQIVMGMEFLAEHKVVHRDLATRNVLICGDGCTVKISDFGMSRDVYLQNVYYKSSIEGKLPIKWMAPEALLHRLYTTQSDVWSFGILLWEIITLGGTPYPGIEMNEVFKLIQTGYRMERPRNCSSELYQLMRWCWQERPSRRPSFSQLRCHLESLLEQNSASTYLTLPVYEAEMNDKEFNCQVSSICEVKCTIPSQDHLQDMNNKNDLHSIKISDLRESSPNISLRNDGVGPESDQKPFHETISASEVADYLTPISVSLGH